MVSPIDIDDISLKPLACPPVIDCDFNFDLCGWSKDTNHEWIWDLGFGRAEDGTKLKFLVPPTDRRSPLAGMFIYTDFTKINESNSYTMKLDSEFVSAAIKGSCLSFYYVAMTFDDTKNSFNIILTDSSGNY